MSNEQKYQQGNAEDTQAILFGLAEHGDHRTSNEVLMELSRLANTCNFEISGSIVQHRRSPDPNKYMGAGKLEEVAELIAETSANVAICNDTLSPAQGRNLEKILQVPTIDRSELIIKIFDTHARSPQAKLQVELARLNYQLPRLKNLWTHLERQRGGIGVRGGAGEKQIQLDRSELRSKIAQAQRKLNLIEKRKSSQVRARSDQFSLALVGYTNAGKSTLMNQLTQANVLAEDRLFSTLDTRTRPWRLPGGRSVLLSDTVGFIDDLPHQLIASFHATLEEALSADLLLMVVDASDPEGMKQLHTVEEVLEQLGAGHIPSLYLLNKCDNISDKGTLAQFFSHAPKGIPISAKTGEGVEQFQNALIDHLATCEETVEILVPHTAGGLRAEIRSSTTVLNEEHTEEGSLMSILVSPRLLGKILAKGATRTP